MSARTGPGSGRPTRRPLFLVGSLVVVLACAAGLWLTLRPASTAGSPVAATSTASKETPPPDPGRSVPLTSSTPTAVPSTVLAGAPGLPTRLTPVALNQPTSYGDGVAARLVGIRSFNARGMGVGEFSGAALAVTVELTNTSRSPVSLATTAVSLYRGDGGIRATALRDGASAPFAGQLAPGKSARATYTFAVPQDQRDVVTVTVGISPATGTAVFSGPVA